MKNIINYYYGFDIDNIRMIKDDYYFNYQNKNYIFLEIKNDYFDSRTIVELNKILLNNNINFFEIIPNKNREIITENLNKKYVLMIDKFKQDRNFDYYDIANTNVKIETNKMVDGLNKMDWNILWRKKVDYFEDYIEQNKYTSLNEYYNYFIGLAENSILYFEDTISKIKPNIYDRKVVSHKRIKENYTYKSLYNPLELIIDHPSRDLSEYLKMIFWNNTYKKNEVIKFLNDVVLSEFSARMVISRLLFPSFFFDLFEKYTDNKLEKKDLMYIIDRMDEYENYVFEINAKLKTKFKIPIVNWIKKTDYSSILTTPSTSGISLTNMVSIPSLSVTSIMLQ